MYVFVQARVDVHRAQFALHIRGAITLSNGRSRDLHRRQITIVEQLEYLYAATPRFERIVGLLTELRGETVATVTSLNVQLSGACACPPTVASTPFALELWDMAALHGRALLRSIDILIPQLELYCQALKDLTAQGLTSYAVIRRGEDSCIMNFQRLLRDICQCSGISKH